MDHFDGAKVRQRREAAGYDRTGFAAAIKRSTEALRNYELGSHSPSAETAGRMAAVLGCAVDDLFSPNQDEELEQVRKLVDAAPPLTPSQRAKLAVLLAPAGNRAKRRAEQKPAQAG